MAARPTPLVRHLPAPVRRLLRLRLPVEALDAVFTPAGDRPFLVFGLALDPRHGNTVESLRRGLHRALDRREFLHLYAHDVGESPGPYVLAPAKLAAVLAAAASLELPVMSYADWLEERQASAGVVLSFDDAFTASWRACLPLLAETGARATFFVCLPQELEAQGWADLQALASAGHEVACHGALHVKAGGFLREGPVGAWVQAEVQPALETLRAQRLGGVSFSYPYGSRTAETDAALAGLVRVARGTAYTL